MAILTSSSYAIPTIDEFKGPIADDDFEIDTAKTNEQKQEFMDARASKLWRTLRIASKSRFNVLDKVDDGPNVQALFEPKTVEINLPADGTDAPGVSNESRDPAQSNGTMTPNVEHGAPGDQEEVNGVEEPGGDRSMPEAVQNEHVETLENIEDTLEITQDVAVT